MISIETKPLGRVVSIDINSLLETPPRNSPLGLPLRIWFSICAGCWELSTVFQGSRFPWFLMPASLLLCNNYSVSMGGNFFYIYNFPSPWTYKKKELKSKEHACVFNLFCFWDQVPCIAAILSYRSRLYSMSCRVTVSIHFSWASLSLSLFKKKSYFTCSLVRSDWLLTHGHLPTRVVHALNFEQANPIIILRSVSVI
jgi:hypothetical protein